ncbi:hypothetical protein C6P42_003639 [Pichia californica]|nr:hypothetical protein C6P42_003639 [[Candida] californica]
MLPGMPDTKVQVEVDPTEDTEWNDILRAKGIIPEKEPDPTEQLEEALADAISKQNENRLEGLDLDELDELEDEEDESFLESYKRKRMEEMKKLSSNEKFGSVYPISKPEWQTEVTDASQKNCVFVHLTCESQIQSRLLSVIIRSAAIKFKDIKFCEIEARRAIEGYPDTNCPTILIYKSGELVKQLITLLMLNGNDTSLKDVEALMVDIGCIDSKDKRLIINQDIDDDLKESHKLRFQKKSIQGKGKNNFSEEEEEDDDDEDDFFN